MMSASSLTNEAIGAVDIVTRDIFSLSYVHINLFVCIYVCMYVFLMILTGYSCCLKVTWMSKLSII
jgi:hypothetical protein